MKKSFVALAVLSSLAGVAAAQSSVTLFGVVDVNFRQVKGAAGTINRVGSDGNTASRLGVRGVEDLGDGLKASFWLESPLAADTGTVDGAFWGRRATVSLAGEFGEIRLGRHKTSHRLVIDDFDPFSTTGLGDVAKVYSGLGAVSVINRSDNQVAYVLPGNLGGVYGSADVALGEAVDGTKTMAGRLGYKDGALHVAGSYGQTDAKNDKYKLWTIAGSYDFGVVRASLALSETKFGANKQSIVQIGAVAPVGPGSLLVSYANANANTDAEKLKGVGDAKLFAIGYNYPLSKRTSLYSTFSQIKNSGTAAFTVGGDKNTAAAGGTSRGFDVGIKHSF
ncbi:porin [Paucibacter sp. APW11]|uniref:Porin n=1 Tax=Roseateles aquae TaxID=3077235 RepID=A0ABU3PHY2_9BURK|nr:porin [Paucibacter sp. APW11]MDT9002162.1 porin [Paucibacter sp. APW11]